MSRARITYLLLAAGLLLVAGAVSGMPAQAADKVMPDLFFKITQNIVTPHIEWARPYYKGKLRALVFAPHDTQRETVELMERLEVDCTPIFLRSESEIYLSGWDWGLENDPRVKEGPVLQQIRAALDQDYDLLIMAKTATDKLPADILQRIEEKIEKGCGLIYICGKPRSTALEKRIFRDKLPEIPAAVTNGIPLDQLPGLRVGSGAKRSKDQESLLSTYRCGNGRVVLIRYNGGRFLYLTPADPDDLSYEYYQAFAIKAILWAAQKESQTWFADFPTAIAGHELPITLQTAGDALPPGPLTLRLSIRSPRRLQQLPAGPVIVPGPWQTAEFLRPVYAADIELAAADRPATFKIPALPEGAYFADVQLLAGAKTVNWAAAAYASTPPLFISAVQCRPETIDCSRAGKAALAVRAMLNAKSEEGATAHFALFDNFDRLLAEKKVPVAGGAETVESSFEIDPADIVCAMLRVRVALSTTRQHDADVKVAGVTTVCRPYPDFSFFAWGGSTQDYVARQTMRVNAATGIVDAYRTRGSVAALDTADARFVSDSQSLRGQLTKVSEGLSCSKPLWGDPDCRRQMLPTIQTRAAAGLKFDTYAFLLGDESTMLNGAKETEATLVGAVAEFRAWLEARYGTIAELNRRWGTRHASFAEIQPISPQAMRVIAAKDANYTPLVDQWTFNFWTYADTVRFVKEAIREVDPQARLGFSTPLWNVLSRGYYWEKIAPQLDFFTPYYSVPEGDLSTVNTAMEFAPPGILFSGHAGSYIATLPDEEYYTMLPHSLLLNGMGNLFWYYLSTGTEGAMSPSLDYYPQTERSVQEVKRLKAGLGRLILGSHKEPRKIAVLFSTPSYLFSFLVAKPHVPWNFNAALCALHRLGYQGDAVSPAQVLAGALDRYQALVLPVAQCLSDEEAEKIRQFVKAGGLVIADVRPGVADAHGKFRDAGALDDVFGVRWRDAAAKPMHDVQLRTPNKAPELCIDYSMAGQCGDVRFCTAPLEKVAFDPALEIAAARPAATYSLPKEGIAKLRQVLAAGAAAGANPLKPKDATDLQRRIEEMEAAPASMPFVLENRFGDGRAVYMNNGFAAFATSGLADVLDAVLTAHGLRPGVTIAKGYGKTQPGRWLPDFFYESFGDGPARYFGFVKNKNQEIDAGSLAYYGVVQGVEDVSAPRAGAHYEIAVDLGTEGHVYEPLSGKYLGLRKSVADGFGPCVAKWYAVLPYQVEALKASLDNEAVKPGERITGTVELIVRGATKPVRHVINIQVLDQQGQSIMYLLRNLDTLDGKAAFSIPTAWNDEARSWTLVLTDAATGVTTRLRLSAPGRFAK